MEIAYFFLLLAAIHTTWVLSLEKYRKIKTEHRRINRMRYQEGLHRRWIRREVINTCGKPPELDFFKQLMNNK